MKSIKLQWCWRVAIAFASTALLGQVASAATFTLENQSDIAVLQVYAGPDYHPQWGEDLLGSSAVLLPGSQRQFYVEAEAIHCVFDIRVRWANGLVRDFMGRDLCENAHVVIDGGRGLIVSNESGTAIGVVNVAPDFEDSWGPDRLGEEEIIAPGHERVIMLDAEHSTHCTFDIRLRTLETAVEYRGRNICEDPRVVLYEGNRLTVVNEGDEDVFYVRVSPDHEGQGWGRDLLGMGGILSPGEELAVRTHQFREDQCLFDVLLEEDDEDQHVYEEVDICRTERLVHPRGSDGGTSPDQGRTELVAGETFRDCNDWGCPWMIVVDGGAFDRGSWERDEETPVTNVTVPGPFAVGQFEVTVGQFAEFARDTGHDGGSSCYMKKGSRWRSSAGNWRDPGFDQDDSHPVVCVNWDDAIAYTRWLADRTGLPYRLPTEAEVELLANASAIDFERSGRANCRGCGSQWDGKSTSPVGRLRPDALSLSGMFGNAAEWALDCYQSGYSNAPRDGSAWSPPSCDRRVIRGGCWSTKALKLRATGRDHGESDRRSSCVGFRVARD